LINFGNMDKLLRKAIENELIRKPSQGFSDQVMERIFDLKKQIPIEPLITKRIWIGVAFTFAALLVLISFVKPSGDVQGSLEMTKRVEDFFSSIHLPVIDYVTNMHLLIASGISLALFLLLFFDLVLSRKK